MRLYSAYTLTIGALYFLYGVLCAWAWLNSWLGGGAAEFLGAVPDAGLAIALATIGILLLSMSRREIDESFKATASLIGAGLGITLMVLQLMITGANTLDAYFLSAVGEEVEADFLTGLARVDVVLGALSIPILMRAYREVRRIVRVAERG